jgi:hypothetical protein
MDVSSKKENFYLNKLNNSRSRRCSSHYVNENKNSLNYEKKVIHDIYINNLKKYLLNHYMIRVEKNKDFIPDNNYLETKTSKYSLILAFEELFDQDEVGYINDYKIYKHKILESKDIPFIIEFN